MESMTSICPLRSDTTRLDSSGTNRTSTDSMFGAGPQYLGFFASV